MAKLELRMTKSDPSRVARPRELDRDIRRGLTHPWEVGTTDAIGLHGKRSIYDDAAIRRWVLRAHRFLRGDRSGRADCPGLVGRSALCTDHAGGRGRDCGESGEAV